MFSWWWGWARGCKHKACLTLQMLTLWPGRLQHTMTPQSGASGETRIQQQECPWHASPLYESREPSRGLGSPLQDIHLEPPFILDLFQVKRREFLGCMHLKVRPLWVLVQPCEWWGCFTSAQPVTPCATKSKINTEAHFEIHHFLWEHLAKLCPLGSRPIRINILTQSSGPPVPVPIYFNLCCHYHHHHHDHHHHHHHQPKFPAPVDGI